MKKNDLPIIYVKYLDHCWLPEDIKKIPNIKKALPYFIEEVGFLISQDKEKIVFCKAINEGFDGKKNEIDYEETTIILKNDIKKFENLKRSPQK